MKPAKKMSPAQVTRIKELYSEGLTAYAVSKKLGIPQGVARYHINREKLRNFAPSSPVLVSPLKKLLTDQILVLDQKKKLLQEILQQDFNIH